MKKLLLGTTALVAGGLIAGVASAADIIPAPIPEPIDEGFSLVISGDAEVHFAFKNTDECDSSNTFVENNAGEVDDALTAAGVSAADLALSSGTSYVNGGCAFESNDSNPDAVQAADTNYYAHHNDESTWIRYDSKLSFDAETTLANGLGFAAHIEMDGHTGSVEDHWVDISGHFGLVSVGFLDSAYKQMFYTDIGRMGVGGGPDDPKAGVLLSQETAGGDIGGLSDGLKIVYVTPRFSGLQLAVSFSPDDAEETQKSDGENHVIDSDDSYVNVWSFGANYEGSIGNHDIVIGGGFGHGDAESSQDTADECLDHVRDQHFATGSSAADVLAGISGDYDCGDADWWGVGGEISNDWVAVGASWGEIETDYGRNRDHWNVGAIFTSGDWEYGAGYGEEEDEHARYGFTDEAQFWSAGITNNVASGVAVGVFVNWRSEDPAYRKLMGLGSLEGTAVGASTRLRF